METEWKAPPPEAFMSVQASFYNDVAKSLRKRPMQWAVLPREYASVDSAKNAALSIRTGKIKTMPKGQYEAVAHDAAVVYVRYLGDDEGAPLEPPDDDDEHDGDGKSYEAVRVRRWAEENAIDVSKHGRLPQALIDRYHVAMAELAEMDEAESA